MPRQLARTFVQWSLCQFATACFVFAPQLLAGNAFPGTHWETKSPDALGLDPAKLDAIADALGGRGCAIKDGYVVTAWGAQDERSDELSHDGITVTLPYGQGQKMPIGPQDSSQRSRTDAVIFPTAGHIATFDSSELPPSAAQQWSNPGSGQSFGPPQQIEPNQRFLVGAQPFNSAEDTVVPIRSREHPVIDTAGFRDGAHHWRRIRDETRIIQAVPDQPAYLPSQIAEIAANILLFQRTNGGWPKDYDMLAILTDEQRAAIPLTKDRTDTSFDNHNIHSQVDYLARAFLALGEPAWRDACERGFDFMLNAQYKNGGFPQRYPAAKGYGAHVTFNDGVMIGILNVLKDAADGAPQFAWLDQDRKNRAQEAVRIGLACILKCQIRIQGTLTGWCQQHDANTLEPASARTFELASLCPQETTEIVRFLMRFDDPSADTMHAMEGAIAWLHAVRLAGIRVEKVPAPREQFIRHTADFDAVIVNDRSAPPIWARHYEIGTNRPIFAGRDGVKRYSLAEIERERRTGTPWYGTWPQSLLATEYPRWREKRGLDANR